MVTALRRRGTISSNKAKEATTHTLKPTMEPNLKLVAIDSLEIHAKTYGVAIVEVNLPADKPGKSMKMRASIFALPRSGGGWQIVAAQYSRVSWR